VVYGLCHGITDGNGCRRAGGRSLRGGGGCPFQRGFVPAFGRNARLWDGVVVNGLCHPAKVRRGRRNRGRERIDGARGEGHFGVGEGKERVKAE